ncbi:MAG: DUF362 domain-containing protein [Nibricoccus sp.]
MKKFPSKGDRKAKPQISTAWTRMAVILAGAAALFWFVVRVVPKPSRAAYPCQRAAFPLASSFVLWLFALFTTKSAFSALKRHFAYRKVMVTLVAVAGGVFCGFAWSSITSQQGFAADEQPYKPGSKFPSKYPVTSKYDWTPGPANKPVGIAKGIFPGRVVWARDPLATKWAGRWKLNEDQWWTDANTDQQRVDGLTSVVLRRLTGATTDEGAWQAIFPHFNGQKLKLPEQGYKVGEIVALKINLNNSDRAAKPDNLIDASPQTILSMVRQLVNEAHVPQACIVVYDARRYMAATILQKIWAEFKDVRFVQQFAPDAAQPINPAYGDHHGLEAADWVEGMTYSAGSNYDKARMIPRQVMEAKYLINFAILKAHSYPYNTMENGDEGQTAITMTGKNHFGSILGTPELHPDINTAKKGTKDAYSPMVDLAASPNLGGKTILYLLDGLYCGRKWKSYPLHFPNPPFNNRVDPYENPDWPASLLASFDGVALDSVGLDILYSQTKNNGDPINDDLPRILIRENADDYLLEMADPQHAPSKTNYVQGGNPVESLGVHEHWDGDATRRYSRNLDPANGKGIELIYVPVDNGKELAAAPSEERFAPDVLPGKGLLQHDFFYAGEWDHRNPVQTMFVIRGGKVVWSFGIPLKSESGTIQEYSDATMRADGSVLFAHMTGAKLVSAEKKILWAYDAPKGCEVHVAQPIGMDRALIVQNGNPAKAMLIELATGRVEKEVVLPVGNPQKVHGQFRRVRLTKAGTLLAAHMDNNKVAEYDWSGNMVWALPIPSPWSANRLANGNTLVTSNKGFVREVNAKGETVWEFSQKDVSDIKLFSLQEATRLPNGHTVISNWCSNGVKDPKRWPETVQVIEVTPDKKVVWALRSWDKDADLGPATNIQLLDASVSAAP